MIHTPVVFSCNGDALVGVVTAPPADADTALLVIVGGPQYRVGSHRQFYQLAQHAAARGFAAMRFDARGMGDAEGAQRSFEEIDDDIAAAIDALQRTLPSIKRVGLWGLCGGASAALLYCRSRRDPRVTGVTLVNPWVRSETTQARTRVKHYYLQRLLQPEFWKKLVSGRVASGAVGELARALRVTLTSSRQDSASTKADALTLEQRMCEGLAGFDGETLLVLSGNDYTAKEFLETVRIDPAWQAQLTRRRVTRLDMPDADHTFSQPAAQQQVEQATVAWLQRLGATQGCHSSPLEELCRSAV